MKKLLSARQRDETFYHLTSSRNTSGRVIFDVNQARRAFAGEVAFALEERAIKGLFNRAHWTIDGKIPLAGQGEGQGWVQLDRG